MKLLGSKTEQEFRQELVRSHKHLFESREGKFLSSVIQKIYPEMKTAYILHWVPEQGEDLYKLLVNDCVVLKVEIDKEHMLEPIFELLTISQYLRKLSKINQIKLAVALDLAKTDMKLIK